MHRMLQIWVAWCTRSPVEVEQGDVLPSRCSSQTVNKCPFHSLLSATFPTFSCFLLVILLLEVASQHSAEVLASIPTHKKSVVYIMEKLCEKLHSGTSCSAVVCELKIIESTVYIK